MNIHVLIFSLWYLCYWCWWQQEISRICAVFVWIIIRQTFLGMYIITLFDYNRPTWLEAVIVEQLFLEKNLNFNKQGETSIFVLPHKASFWHFCQSGTLPDEVNMEVSPDIWNINNFWATSLRSFGVHNLFQRQRFSNWMCSRVKLKTEELVIGLVLFNSVELYVKLKLYVELYVNFSELVILSLNVDSVSLHAYELIEGLEEGICTFFKVPLFNWNWKCVG